MIDDRFVRVECAIRQLHANFVDAVWRQDSNDFAACFAPDGVWKIGGKEMHGREDIRAQVGPMLGQYTRIQLVVQTCQLRLEGEVATSRQPMIELSQSKDGTGYLTIGFYHDRYRMVAGEWLFAERFWSLKYRGPTDLSAAMFETPDYGSFPAGPAPDETSFRRPG